MATIKVYLDYAELAQASYSDLAIGIPDSSKLTAPKKAEFTSQEANIFPSFPSSSLGIHMKT